MRHAGQQLATSLHIRVVVLVDDLFDLYPLLDDFGPQLFLTLLTQVLYLSAVRVTIMAELIEENVDLKISIQYFALVFPYIFG